MRARTEVQIGKVCDATSIVYPSELVPGVVQIWLQRLKPSTAEVSASFLLLSRDEQERADRFRIERARNDFVLTRGRLRILLAGYLGMSPQELQFRYGNRGKPVLEGNSELCFNISHTDGLALMAFAKRRNVGVDVEKLSRRTEAMRLAQRFFSE